MHWRNSNFQILHFIVGACHTADEAYRKLYELREERNVALKQSEASSLLQQAKLLRHKRQLDSDDAAEVLEAQAGILELESTREQTEACIEAAKKEVEFIDNLIERIEPHRKYKNLPALEAHQATQREEWLYELKSRAENFLLSGGGIPADQLAVMRMHPGWEEEILPHIESVKRGEVLLHRSKPKLLQD